MHYRHGLTLGKFLPLHQGHELLLTVAASRCETLTVLVGTTADDRWSFETRARWIRDALARRPDLASTQLNIVNDPDPDPNVAKDASGTVTDETYWRTWLAQNATHFAALDAVFTSDVYGAHIAERAGVEWCPVDPDRTVYPISGSQILANPAKHFARVSEAARPDVGATVAVLGAESTGKSTLVESLVAEFGCGHAPEWGRIISEAKPELTVADFDAIVTIQAEMILGAQRHGNGLAITDTEAITTALFAPLYLDAEHEPSWDAARRQRFDLYLVLAPTVPWVNDGTRILDHGERQAFHDRIVGALEALRYRFTVIDDQRFEARTDAARQAVNGVLAMKDLRLV
ncbi:MAG: AAA family ATPase [Pseudomonadota bacterium]